MAVYESITKTCTRCGENKPISEFALCRGKPRARCKPCHSQDALDWRNSNIDVRKEREAEYRANNREKLRERDAQYNIKNAEKHRANAAKWASENKDRVREIQRKWSDSNREKIRKWRSARHAKNPEEAIRHSHDRRARKLQVGGKLSRGLGNKLFILQRGKCACCGKPLGSNYHLDHIMPLALGGSNTDDNIQLLRAECNRRKHAKHPIDFMQSKGFLL